MKSKLGQELLVRLEAITLPFGGAVPVVEQLCISCTALDNVLVILDKTLKQEKYLPQY